MADVKEAIERLEQTIEALREWAAAYPESDDDNSIENLWARYGSEFAAAMRKTREALALPSPEGKATVKENLMVQFLTDAAEWFERRAVETKEDREHWAMIANARNCREAASALSTSRAAEKQLGELLAVIHRDGGQYQALHGTEKAVEDAHLIWAALVKERDEMREALKPFSEAADDLDGERDTANIWESPASMNITAGDLRRARAASQDRPKGE